MHDLFESFFAGCGTQSACFRKGVEAAYAAVAHPSADRGSCWSACCCLRRTVSCRLFYLVPRLVILPVLGLLLVGYSAASIPITLVVNGQAWHWHTHQTSVSSLLREVGVVVQPEDLVFPSLDTALASQSIVRVEMARPIKIEVDGREIHLLSRQQPLVGILPAVGVTLKPEDELLIQGGQPRQPDWLAAASDSPAVVPCFRKGAEVGRDICPENCSRPAALRIVVRRSVPVVLVDGGVSVTFLTNRPTVGEALRAQGVLVYPGDRVLPGQGTSVVPGLSVYIQRSTPVTVHVDGTTLQTRTQRRTVGEVLAQAGVSLMGKDYAVPPLEAPVSDDLAIQVVRVKEVIKVEQETIPHETEWVATPNAPIDTQQIVQVGSDGVTKRRYRVTYENGQPTSDVLEDQWLDHLPSSRVIAYGTQFAVQMLKTPDGPMEYWRRIRVFAASYSAATAGKPKDHPKYGVTRAGLKAGYGVIAVDPNVFPLGSWVYVPGYGKAIAGDIGPSVLGRRVDLGFDDDKPLTHWYHWVDIYLLTPAPSRTDIRYVLPNWPPETQ